LPQWWIEVANITVETGFYHQGNISYIFLTL